MDITAKAKRAQPATLFRLDRVHQSIKDRLAVQPKLGTPEASLP